MDRNREARRASMAPSANGLPRRRQRSSSLRDSPEEDGPVELQEPTRLRDRGVKKERDRDRDRDRDRSSRSKRRRGDRLMHGSNRGDDGEDSSDESVNDEDDDDDEGGGSSGGGGAVRMLPSNPSISSSISNHHHQHRRSYPPPGAAKVFRQSPGWKPTDEMIGFSVPRKARSVSTKRSHECWVPGSGVGGEQIHPQASTSPVGQSLASTSTPSPTPISPSSSTVPFRKKLKLNGSKPRPPKSSSKSSSSNPEELEIEIAEVLYGLMTQTQGPSKKEIMANDLAKFDSRELNKSNSDVKSRISSPISNSASTTPQSSSMVPQNSCPSTTPISAVAPKRKRPRQVADNMGGLSVRNSPISSTTLVITKVEIDQPAKTEIPSPNLEKNPGSASENGVIPHDFAVSEAVQPSSEPPPPELGRQEPGPGCAFLECKPVKEESREFRDVGPAKEEAVASPKIELPAVSPEGGREDVAATEGNSTIFEIESQLEGKFQIDLMAPPPQSRSSPEREARIEFAAATERQPTVTGRDAELRSMANDKEEEEKPEKSGREEAVNVEPELKKAKPTSEAAAESERPFVSKERNLDLQLDLEKPERESGSANKLHQHLQKKEQSKSTREEPPLIEKTAQSSSFTLPMSMASWPGGGLPPMGYMAPLQGVVSMDGSPIPSAPIQPLFSQPRAKRCATHCYIARNIHYLQQLMKMNPFWPAAAAGSASLFGGKPGNLSVLPSAELQGSIAGRNTANSVQDKGQGLAIIPAHSGKDKVSQAANIADAHRKQQILLQQALPPGAPPSNILHGPAFIFPLNQQQAAAAASVRPASVKSPSVVAAGSVASTNASNSASVNGSATAVPVTAAAVSFNYPNMAASETQYLAILQNNAYPFPIPTVGTPPTYRGTHAQAIPYFGGSFYSSQMIHPPQQMQQQSNQNTSVSSGSSSSQKHLQTQQQQQRPQGSTSNGGNGNGNLHSFPAPKNRPSQALQQQQQQHPNQHLPTMHHGREDSPSTADSRVSRASMSVYGQNFAMPIHQQNFALMAPSSALAGASSGGANQTEKKQQQPSQQPGLMAGPESVHSQTFAMSFASFNGIATSTAPSMEISSVMAQNHAVLQGLPEATKHNYQIIAAAAAAQQKKNLRVSEEGKTGGGGGDFSSVDEEKKGLAAAGKAPATVGQSIVFSRPDLTNTSVSAPSRTSRSGMPNTMPNTISTVTTPISQLQTQLQYQQQQMMQLQKHQQQLQHQHQQQIATAAAARNRTPATSNGSLYGDHLASSSPAAKFPNPLSGFAQNLVQSNNNNSSPAQSPPQWKNSARTNSQVPSSSTLKNFPQQQQARTQQSHTQISFGASQKPSVAAPNGQAAPNSHQSSSPPMVVGSPTSSLSKGGGAGGGSPRTMAATSSSQGNKAAQPSTLSSSHHSKNSPTVTPRKSSPVGGRNVTSMLGNPHVTSSSSNGTKPQVQQPQLFFNPAYLQAQTAHSSGGPNSTSGYYLHRRRTENHQQPQGSSSTSSSTSDAKAAAALAASNMKGGGLLPSHGILLPAQFTTRSSGNSHQLVPAGFSYVQPVPTAVPVKPAEQKQPAGNDNLHACWQPPEKK